MTLTDKIAQAIGDPGSVLPRAVGETVTRWSTRAVEAVLNTEGPELYIQGRRAAASDVSNMSHLLDDAGWEYLIKQAEAADYDPRLVRRRRQRDDFTRATIESAYQYGYRQAAKVARGEAR